MGNIKYLILGAGPSGLTFANCLKNNNETDFLVLEAENEAGGLCRSTMVDGSPLDIGGGHFLDVRQKEVCDFLFLFMPESEWNLFERNTCIDLKGTLVGHPLEANIWQLSQEEQIEYLKSIAVAGCNLGEKMPEKFVDWIYWKLGSKIASDYMIPYNSKMFGDDLNTLGVYWLNKLPDVSFEETLLSCLNRKPYGRQPGHASFYYPKKFGYGEVWLRMAGKIKTHIRYNQSVVKLDIKNHAVVTQTGNVYTADYIVNTVPWNSFDFVDNMGLGDLVLELKHTGIKISYYQEDQKSNAQWIYVPDKDVSYHRILSRRTFCPDSRGYWTETNLNRAQNDSAIYSYNNEYAYPLNTVNKPQIMEEFLQFMKKYSIYGLGRWGEHQHYNSDVVVKLAMDMANEFTGK